MTRRNQDEGWTADEAWPAHESGAGPDRDPHVARLSLGQMMGVVFYFAAHNAVAVAAGGALTGTPGQVRPMRTSLILAVNILATLSISTYLAARWHIQRHRRRERLRYDQKIALFDLVLSIAVNTLAIGYGALFWLLGLLLS